MTDPTPSSALSNCCNAPMATFYGHFGTNHYQCSSCKKACDPKREELPKCKCRDVKGNCWASPGVEICACDCHKEIQKKREELPEEAMEPEIRERLSSLDLSNRSDEVRARYYDNDVSILLTLVRSLRSENEKLKEQLEQCEDALGRQTAKAMFPFAS